MSVIGVKRPSTKLSGAIHLTGNMPVIHVRKKKKFKVLNVKNSSEKQRSWQGTECESRNVILTKVVSDSTISNLMWKRRAFLFPTRISAKAKLKVICTGTQAYCFVDWDITNPQQRAKTTDSCWEYVAFPSSKQNEMDGTDLCDGSGSNRFHTWPIGSTGD